MTSGRDLRGAAAIGDGSGDVPHADADLERWIVDEVPAAARQRRRCWQTHLADSLAFVADAIATRPETSA